MSIGDGSEPVADDEVVYRRVSDKSGWYDPSLEHPVAWLAFRPNEQDSEGISVWRSKYKTLEQVASTEARPNRRYFVLVLNVGKLRKLGVRVEPSPSMGGPGHASLVNMSNQAYSRNKDEVRELANRIATDLIESVQGPFGPYVED